MDGVLLAGAGLARLHFEITPEGRLQGDAVPEGLLATRLSLEEMLPCVGQGAVGIEIREPDGRLEAICERLNHYNTRQCVTAERAFLRAMGGGCQAPVAAYAEVTGAQLHMRAVSYHDPVVKRAEGRCDLREAERLGERLARELASGSPAR
jgi:hydroxymethylbilane synthase